MGVFLSFLRNQYIQILIILSVCYVMTKVFTFPLNNCDYLLVVYILILHDIDDENALKYAFLFGLAYDLQYQIYLGLGVLLFQVLNYVKIIVYQMVNMSKFYSHYIFIVVFIAFYTMVSMRFFGYASVSYFRNVVYFTMINVSAVIVVMIISMVFGGFRAFQRS